MQRIAGIQGLGMAWTDVLAAQHLQACGLYPAQQLLARAQLQMLGKVRDDQPAFATRQQVAGQALEKAAQHAGDERAEALRERLQHLLQPEAMA